MSVISRVRQSISRVGASAVAYLGSPSSFGVEKEQLQKAANLLGLKLLALSVRNVSEFDDAFETTAKARIDGLLVGQDALLQRNTDQISNLAARHRIPAIHVSRISAVAGGLMSYGTRYSDAYRIIGNYAGRILNGEKAGNLPVQQISKVELVINQKAAKVLGITVPLNLFARADEVIE
jgi:putative tryptophan/tyrosine transport system substrate-binding protein